MIINRLWLIIITGIALFPAQKAFAQCPGRDSFAVSGPTCLNKNTTFVNYSNGGANTYDFKWGDGAADTGITTTASQKHKYTSTGTYVVWMVRHFTSPACTDSDSLHIKVNPTTAPTVSFTYSPIGIRCVGTTITFVDLSTGENSPSWLWDFGDGTTSTVQNPTHQFFSSGSGTVSFTVKLTVSNYGGCGTNSATQIIKVKQAIQPQIGDSINVFSQFTRCNSTLVNDTFTIGLKNNDPGDSAVTYSIDWGDGSSVFNAGSSFLNKAHTYTSLGEFTLKYTAKDTNGCSWTEDTIIVNESNPSVGVADNGATQGCQPQTFYFKLTARNVSPTTKFVWDFGDGTPTVTWDYTKALDSIKHTFTKTSCGHNTASCVNCFVVSVAAINACDSTTGTVDNIKIFDKPKPNFTPSTGLGCVNAPINFTNNTVTNCSNNGATNFKWLFGDGFSSTLISPTHKFLKQGTFNVSLVATNSCGSDTITKSIEIDSVPVSNFSFTGAGSPGCAPVVVNFKDSSTGKNITFLWTVSPSSGFSFTNSTTSTSQNPQITFSSANTYIVTQTVTNGCGIVSKSDTIVVPTKPVVILNSIPNHCGPYTITPSASFNNEGSAITAYSWTFTGGSPTSSNSQNPGSVVYASTGSYTVTVSAKNACGTTSDTKSFKVNPFPNAKTAANQTICAGSSVNIGTTAVGGDTYSWSSVPSGFSSISSNPTVSPLLTTSYILTETVTATGCQKTDTVTITVNPLPAANTGPNKSICIGKSTTIGAASVAGDTYSWTPATGLSSTTMSNPTANPASTKTYTLTETVTATGCAKSNTVKVTVNPLPAANAGPNQTICSGSSVNIGTTTVAGSSYLWKSSTGLSSTTTSNPGAAPASTTTYTLTETNSNGCVDSNSVTVTVNPIPAAAPGNPATICAGQSVSIGTTAVGGDTYSWSPSTGLSSSTVSNPTATPASTTTYTVTEKVTATGCTNSNTVKITVNPMPLAKTGGPQTICKGQSATIGSAAVGGDSYSWTSQPTGFTSTSSSASVNPASTTTYYLTETVTATGCKRSDSAVITVDPIPTPAVSGSATVCAGNVNTYSTTHNVGNTYSWIVQGGTITAGASTSSITVAWGTGSSGRVSVLETTGGSCSDSAFMTVAISPLPIANAGSSVVICKGKSPIIGSSSVAGDTYSWTPSTGLSSTTISNPVASPASTTTYTLTETVTATGCTKSNIVKITVNPLPAANTGPNQTMCSGSSVNLGTSTVPGSSYSWKPSTGLSSSTISNPSAAPASTTTYTLTETNSNGCIDSNSVTVTVNPVPAATANPATICLGQSVSIGTTAVGGDTYLWSPSTGLSSTTASNPTATPASTTTYTLTEKVTATGCTNSNTVKVTVNPVPAPNAGGPQTLCKGQSVTIGSSAVAGDAYSWTSQPTGFTSTSSSTSISPTTTTVYYLTETITATGCKKSDSAVITVNPTPKPSIPGAAVCAGDTDVYNTTNNVGNSYSWVVQGGNIISGSGTHSITVAWGTGSSGRVRVLEKVVLTGCQDSAFKAIIINPLPIPDPGSPSTICNSKSAQIGSTAVGGDKYNWTSNPSGYSSTVANPIVSPNKTTDYHLTVTNTSTGCKKADSVKITVNPLPIVSTSPPDTFCNTSITATMSGNPSGGTWKGKGVTSSGVFTPSTTGVGVDTLYYVYTSPSTGCTDSAKHIVNVVSPPNVIAGQNDTVCIGASNYKLKNYSPAGGAWSGTGIINPDSFSIFKAGAGVFTLTYTVGKNTCKVSSSKIVKVNALPIVSAGNSDSVCLNLGAFALSGYSPSGGLWSGTGITDKIKGIFNPKVAGVGSHLLTYLYTDPKTHCSNFDTISIKVLPLPSVVMNNDTFQCKGVPAHFSATSGNTASYRWLFGDGATGVGSKPRHAYSNTGTYTILLISSASDGCQDTLSSKIRISEPLVANFSRTPYSGTGPLTVSFTNLSSGEIDGYEWNFGNNDSTTNQVPPNDIYQQSYYSDTTYYITLAVENRCGTRVHEDSVLVFALPKSRFGTDRDAHCTPFLVHFSNKSVGSPTSYFWDFGNGKTDTAKNPPPMVYTTDTTIKQFTITLIAKNKYGADTFKHIITVLPDRIIPFFNASDTAGCAPLAVQFTDFSRNVSATYVSWSFGDGDSSSLQNPLYTFTRAGIYTVKEFVNDGCSYDTTSVKIIVHAKPPVNWKATPNCANDSMKFTNLSSNFSGCKWSFGDGDSSIVISPKHAYAKVGKYWVTLTIQSLTYGCPSSYSDSVEVDSVPKASFSASPLSGCRPLDVKFTNTGTSNNFYSWDFGDGNTSPAENPDHVYPDSGIYVVKFSIITPIGCTNEVRKNISVFAYPHARFAITPDPVCGAPHTVQFQNQSIGATGYSWNFSNGKFSINNSPSENFDSTGTYNAKLVAVNSYGCKDSIIHSFTIYRPPVAAFIPQTVGCQSAAVYFKNTSAYMDKFLWDFGDNTIDSVNANPSHMYISPGSYIVTLNITGDGGCTDQISKNNAIIIEPKPVAGFTFIPETNPTTGWVQFYADTAGIVNYSWNWGDLDSTNGVNANPKHKYDEPGTYTVKLVVTNKFGCIDTITHLVTITYFEGLFIPNALAPNSGPPEERVFLPKAATLQTYRLRIYTTWGELLWENEDLNNGHPATGWDGTTDGKPLAEGVYVWKIDATFLNGEVWKGKDYNGELKPMGTVTLVR